MFMEKFYRKLNEAGGLGDGGSAGGDAGGDSGDGANSSDAGSTGGTGGDSGDFAGPEWARSLNLSVDKDILTDPALGPISDVNSLVKSYVHAQRQIGKKGVLIPSETSTKEEWDQFYQKTGVPLDTAKYKESVKVPAGEENVLGEEFNNGFLQLAHESRVHPNHAQKMYEYFTTKTKESAAANAIAAQQKTQAELDALQEKIGVDAYGVKLAKATHFIKENTSPEFLQFLGESGLSKNAHIVETFMNLADKLGGEITIPGGDGQRGWSKSDIEREINSVMGNMQDPYYNTQHPDHARRINEVAGWRARLEK